uniref:RAD51 paralog C n=1 Tax=Homo sapiens TaxID=9606 RepID=A0A8V8TL64_HUMAN
MRGKTFRFEMQRDLSIADGNHCILRHTNMRLAVVTCCAHLSMTCLDLCYSLKKMEQNFKLLPLLMENTEVSIRL